MGEMASDAQQKTQDTVGYLTLSGGQVHTLFITAYSTGVSDSKSYVVANTNMAAHH